MGKISVNELATKLIDRKGLSKKQAASFVNDMFDIIQKGLEQDKIMKVKGFGTFKIISVDDRESINVNTGERVLIGGHSKITFTPDNVMKELVNKPFSQFETVVLNDGVEFEDAPDSSASEENEATSAPLVDFVTEPEPVRKEPVVQQKEPLVEKEVNIPILLGELEDSNKSETPAESESSNEEEYANEVESPAAWKKWIIPVLFLLIGFSAGYLVCDTIHEQYAIPKEFLTEDETLPEPQPQPVVTDSMTQDKTTVEDSVAVMPEVKEEPQPEPVVSMDKYEKMDSRVLHGAYRIVGTDHVEKIKATDNLARICKRTIGPGMECYLEVYNGIKGDADLKPGKDIKIPKLELKKKNKTNNK